MKIFVNVAMLEIGQLFNSRHKAGASVYFGHISSVHFFSILFFRDFYFETFVEIFFKVEYNIWKNSRIVVFVLFVSFITELT